MAFVYTNPNPSLKLTGDCVIRAISLITGNEWEDVYLQLAVQGFLMHDLMSSNEVWSAYLKNIGFTRHIIPDTCPECYTVEEFTEDNPEGEYMLATGTHVVAVKDGDYYDTWDSGNEIPIYYFKRGD